MKIAIGSDHGGYGLKEEIKRKLEEKGIEILDCGCFSEESCDYPDFAEKVARAVGSGEVERGILVCKTGIGMAIAANKVTGVRAANCRTVDDARLSRQHNDSNVLALGAGVVDPARAKEIVDTWLETPFEGGRHQKRVDKISGMEKR
ncbi:MAG: ribose 5-phosphate isomerase B [Candidatus Tritonobacter lacicola]|nr:ribose 5-phosphate isomerase B [Candidatus Tritonobacter lacicola]